MAGNLSKADDGAVEITGGTDGTTIGNTSDRLKVDAAITSSASVLPYEKVMYSVTTCLNGASALANVNGSVTPVNFDFTPAAGETWYLQRVMIFLSDTGTTGITNFGAIAGLTNGVDFRVRSNGTEYLVNNFKTNQEISMVFPDYVWAAPSSGFLEQADLRVSGLVFNPPIKLTNSTADYVRFRVRDNLTSVDQLRFNVKVWRTI